MAHTKEMPQTTFMHFEQSENTPSEETTKQKTNFQSHTRHSNEIFTIKHLVMFKVDQTWQDIDRFMLAYHEAIYF